MGTAVLGHHVWLGGPGIQVRESALLQYHKDIFCLSLRSWRGVGLHGQHFGQGQSQYPGHPGTEEMAAIH